MRYLFLCFVLAVPPPLWAQDGSTQICFSRDDMIQKLETRFGATRQAVGLWDPDKVVELWLDETSGDWTLVTTYTNGRSCILAFGEDWEVRTPPEPA